MPKLGQENEKKKKSLQDARVQLLKDRMEARLNQTGEEKSDIYF